MAAAAAAPYAQVVDEMSKAGELGAQLQGLLRARGSPEAGVLSDRIMDAIYRAIDAAKAAAAAAAAAEEGSEVHSEVTCTGGGGGKRKASAAAAAGADKRAGSRRRTQQSSVETRTTKEMDDGHAWRKYGQKEIQNSKHPKAYFRCTHKYDQGCLAQRQVQRCDGDPDTFRVTYIGAHTCRDPAAAAPLVVHAAGDDELHVGSRLISFTPPSRPNASATTASGTTTASNHHQHHQQADRKGAAAGGLLPPLKLEGGDQEEVLSSLTPAGSSAAAEATRNAAATPGGPDQGDVTSGLHFYGGDVGFPMGDDEFDLLEDLFLWDDGC